jgi:hypothetical protein
VSGGGGLSGVDVSDDDDVKVRLLLSADITVSIVLSKIIDYPSRSTSTIISKRELGESRCERRVIEMERCELTPF